MTTPSNSHGARMQEWTLQTDEETDDVPEQEDDREWDEGDDGFHG